MAGGVSSSTQDSRRRVLVRRGKRILLRNEAQLNCVSLRSRFDCVVRRGLSRVEMNAQKTGALDSPLRTEGRVFSFFAGQRRRCYRGDVTPATGRMMKITPPSGHRFSVCTSLDQTV